MSVVDSYNPGSFMTKFISNHLKLGKIKNAKLLSPKFSFVSCKNNDIKMKASIAKLKSDLIALRSKPKDELEINNVTAREDIKDLEERIKTLEKTGFESKNVINVNNYQFISSLIGVLNTSNDFAAITSNIYDAELRGLLDMAVKGSFNNPKKLKKDVPKPTDEDKFEHIVKTLGLTKLSDKNSVVHDKFVELISDMDRFRIKVFNMCFEHPVIKSEEGKRDVKSYLLKSYKHMDEIMDSFAYDDDEITIVNKILENNREIEISTNEGKKKVIIPIGVRNLIRDNVFEESLGEVLSKEVKTAAKQLNAIVKNTRTFITYLSKFDKEKFKHNVDAYFDIVSKLKNTISYKPSTKSVQDLVISYVRVLRFLRSMDKRPDIEMRNNKEVKNATLDKSFMKDFNLMVPIKFSKKVKDKILKCVKENIEVQFVEVSTDVTFTLEEFSNLQENDEVYDRNTYAKFGSIIGVKLPKNIRIAIGLRLVSELLRSVKDFELQHKNKDNFSIVIAC